ncbi:hypothetical protein C0J52_01277 [Blattella germanica]|nr:hypothetical protein C0J52_01277 [Blattella germanica]
MQRHHLSSDQVVQQRGKRQVDIADLIVTSQSVLSRVLSRFRDTSLVTRRHGSASNRKTTPRQDLHIIIQAKRTPFATARHIQQDLQNATGLLVSDHTLKNRLWEEGLTSYRPLLRLALEPIHRRQRLDWVNQRTEQRTQQKKLLVTHKATNCHYNHNRRHTENRPHEKRSFRKHHQQGHPHREKRLRSSD